MPTTIKTWNIGWWSRPFSGIELLGAAMTFCAFWPLAVVVMAARVTCVVSQR